VTKVMGRGSSNLHQPGVFRDCCFG
jgi:hypothetical protein